MNLLSKFYYFFSPIFVWASSGCHNKTPQTEWLNRSLFLSPGGWDVKSQGVRCLWIQFPDSWRAGGCLLTVSSQGSWGRSLLLGWHSFHHGAPLSQPHLNLITYQKPHLQIPHCGLRLQIWIGGRAQCTSPNFTWPNTLAKGIKFYNRILTWSPARWFLKFTKFP